MIMRTETIIGYRRFGLPTTIRGAANMLTPSKVAS